MTLKCRVAYIYLIILLASLLPSNVICQEMGSSDTKQDSFARDITPFFLNEFEEAYGKKKLQEISYDYLSFSPKGGFLAIAISQITTGDPEQIWIIDLKSHKVRLVTEPVVQGKVGFQIEKMSWESEGIFTATIHRIDWLHQENNKTISIRATIDVSEQTLIANPEHKEKLAFMSPSNLYEIQLSPFKWLPADSSTGRGRKIPATSKVIDLKDNKVLLNINNAEWLSVKWINDNYFAFVRGFGHGSFILYAGEIKPKIRIFQIASGSWELLEYIVGPTASAQIIYAKHLDKMNNSIIFYDLNRKAEDKLIYLRQWPWRMALSVDNQLAFSARNCATAIDKFTNLASPAEEATRKLCLMQLQQGQAQSFKASFDCNNARSAVEKTICGVKELSDADIEMASIYGSLLSRLSEPEKSQLKQEQLDWLKKRNTSCGKSEKIADCIRDIYKKRIDSLKNQK